MKTIRFITLAALVGSCTIATAQERPERPQRPERAERPIPAAALKEYDKDGDGKLSEDERKAMRADMQAKAAERRAEALKKYDTDGDGKLSEDERKAMRDDMLAGREAMLEKYDANKNGKLDPEEVKAAREAGEKLPWIGPGRDGGRVRGEGGRLRGGERPAAPEAE